MIIHSEVEVTVVGKRTEQGKKDPSKTNYYIAVVDQNGEAENFYVSETIYDLVQNMNTYIMHCEYNTKYQQMSVRSMID